ncbi:MAG: hypothetical protein ACTS73_02115 [Arsenophonus sp. NEOnobi-MAG3]
MNNKILEEFNRNCINSFLELIIYKESILCSNKAKCYETFTS